MKNIFSSKPVISKITEIENKSEEAISIFKTTLDSLIALESDVLTEVNNKEVQIDAIKAEMAV